MKPRRGHKALVEDRCVPSSTPGGLIPASPQKQGTAREAAAFITSPKGLQEND